MSKAVRLRDKRCVCCGTPDNLQDGHFISRRFKGTAFDPLNNHAQCASCNIKHNYDTAPYSAFMVRTYGKDIFDILESRKLQWQGLKYPHEEKAKWLEYWTKELEKLQNEGGAYD